jgi:hypothetical protein
MGSFRRGAFLLPAAGQAGSVTPRPLFRSITFWSGILMMGFICWAWLGSAQFYTEFFWKDASLGQGSSGIDIFYEAAHLSPFGGARTWGVNRVEIPGGFPVDLLPAPRADWSELPDRWGVSIPHWLLLLAVALPWFGLMLWRARRHRRAGTF